jgi:thioredoxin 1
MAFEFTDANFKDKSASGVSVVDFWAEWCGPCKMIGPSIEELYKEYNGKAVVGKMDVDANSQVPSQFGIRAIPTILFFKDGELVDKHVGMATKQALKQKLDAVLGATA